MWILQLGWAHTYQKTLKREKLYYKMLVLKWQVCEKHDHDQSGLTRISSLGQSRVGGFVKQIGWSCGCASARQP